MVKVQPTDYDLCKIAGSVVPQFASGEWELLSCQLYDAEVHGKSAIAWYAFTYLRPDRSEAREDMVAKLYRKRPARARTTYEGMQRLWEDGFGPHSPFKVPWPYGYSAEPPVLFMQKAQGEPWREVVFRSRKELVSSSQRAADWLLHLHDSSAILNRANRRVITARVQRFYRELAILYPDLAPRLNTLGNRIVEALLKASGLRPSHGDFHSRNVFLTPEITTGIDLDNLALREPAFDVGYAIGHLLMRSWYRTGSHDLGALAANTFLHRYLGQSRLDPSRVRLNIGRSILQSVHYSIVKHNPRFTTPEPWLDLIDRFLQGKGKMPLLET